MTSYVTHLESAIDGTQFAPGQVYTTHKGRPLWVRYDLDAVGQDVEQGNALQAAANHVALSRASAP